MTDDIAPPPEPKKAVIPLVISRHPELVELIGKEVVPLMPFLIKKAFLRGDQSLDAKLNAMTIHALVPNTMAWSMHFGTTPPFCVEKPINGRRVFHDGEVLA